MSLGFQIFLKSLLVAKGAAGILLGECRMTRPAPTRRPPKSAQPTGSSKALREGQNRFISIWGEMGSSWGIPRTMAEVHALLYIVHEPLNTDQIMERLAISRGSASMSLKSLHDWGLISRAHKRGDRKEYFRAEHDVWQVFRIITRERKRREIDPVLMALHDCRDVTGPRAVGLGGDDPGLAIHNERLDRMIDFIELIDSLAEQFVSPAGSGLQTAVGLLGKVV